MKNLTPAHKSLIVDYLLAYRVCNYGYDCRAMKRIQQQATRARKALRARRLEDLDWNVPFMSRIQIDEKTGVYYVAGQSANEEIINAMRALCGKFRWVS